jgi:succinyl-diaminopimelate desuccinylase
MSNTISTRSAAQTPDFFDVLSSLISIPSVKSEPLPGAPYGKYTAEALDYMLSLGRECGFSVKNIDGRVGYIEWGSGDKMVAILCHLDVVPPGDGWETDPYTLVRRNGILTGRGVIDDKGPAVCVFFSLLRLKNGGFTPSCRIRLIMGLDEEHGCSCMEHYVKNEELPIAGFTPDADFPAIFAEKGILQISLSGKPSGGCLASAGEAPNMVPSSCTISFTDTGDSYSAQGIPAHASTPDAGVNAILKAVSGIPAKRLLDEPVLAFIDKYFAETSAELLISSALPDISGELTINPAILTINEAVASITLDIRYPVKSDLRLILQEISDNASDFDLNMEIISQLPPKFIDPASDQIRYLLSVYEKHQNLLCKLSCDSDMNPPEAVLPVLPIAIGGGTYARSMPGIVAFGPVLPWEDAQAHRKNEGFRESVALQLIELYKDAIKLLCENIT